MPHSTLTVREVVRATPRTRIIRLNLGDTPFSFVAGQAAMVGLHGSPLRKPYSIASAPSEAAQHRWIQLLLQVDDSGGLDPHLECAVPGTLIDLHGPFGSFGVPDAPAGTPLLFVAGGTGIAPLRSMLFEAMAAASPPFATVVYSARAPEELTFLDDLEPLAQAGRIALHVTVTRGDDTWTGRRGRIDAAWLRQVCPAGEPVCLVCGPPPFVSDTTAVLRAHGIDEGRILIEHYDR